MRIVTPVLVAALFLAASPAYARDINLGCMQTAVNTYENTLIAVTDTYAAAVKAAQVTHRDAVTGAWGIADRDQRKTAIRNADKTQRDSVRSASRTLRDAERSAKSTYKTASRACES